MVRKAQKLRSFALCSGLNRPFVCTCETQTLTSPIYALPSSQDTNICTYKNKLLNCSLCSTKTSTTRTFSSSYCCSFVTIVPNMLLFISFHFKICIFPEYINKPTKCTSLVMLVIYILYTIIYLYIL